MRTNYSVVIVDDHSLFAQALENLVNTFENYNVLYTVKNGADFLQKLTIKENIPDIAVIDINMPIMNGIEATKWLTKNLPEVKVIALSMDDEESTIIRMLRAGAKGYLLKDINPSTLLDAFEEVMERGFYYSERITSTVLTSMNKNTGLRSSLKEREIEFLKLVCTEKTYKEIASDMFLSPKTIDGYRESLFEKLEIKSRVGLVLYAIKEKIFNLY